MALRSLDLMIGDWLYYKGQFNAFPFKVESITKKKVGYHAEPNEHRMYYLRLSECKPIPLTPEILEKIGFVTKDEEGHWTGYRIFKLYDNGKCKLSVQLYHKVKTDCEISLNSAPYWICLKYIHELQHALRLCGIEKEIEL